MRLLTLLMLLFQGAVRFVRRRSMPIRHELPRRQGHRNQVATRAATRRHACGMHVCDVCWPSSADVLLSAYLRWSRTWGLTDEQARPSTHVFDSSHVISADTQTILRQCCELLQAQVLTAIKRKLERRFFDYFS